MVFCRFSLHNFTLNSGTFVFYTLCVHDSSCFEKKRANSSVSGVSVRAEEVEKAPLLETETTFISLK